MSNFALSKEEAQKLEKANYDAREIVAGCDLVKKPIRHKTLYYGLKLNHARNVAIVHPVMFTLRRIIYALCIVLIATLPLLGVWIMLVGTLVMLAYAVTEWQWKARIINHQHIFNEITTYIVCIHLLMFTNYNTAQVRVLLGFVLLGVFVIFLVYNSIIMLICLCHNIVLWIRRCTTQSRRQKLKKEARHIISKI